MGSFEIYRKFDHTSSLIIERTTVHVSDDAGRIAMLETRTLGNVIDDHSTAEELVRYIYSNHLQSASLELDETGEIISYEEYHPYGTTSYQAMNMAINAVAKRYRYTGKERDDESGLYYHGARYYITWLARWSAVDPINSENYNIKRGKPYRNLERNHTELSSSPYEYSFDNPIVFSDPNGEQATAKEYKQSTFQKVLNVEHYAAKLIAKVAGGTFTVSGFGSASFGSVRSFSVGKGTDQYGNVALFYSRTATKTPSVSMNLGAEIGGKVAIYPGYDDVSKLRGKAATFTVSGSLDKAGIPLSAGASLEYDSDEKLVGFGLQLSGGTSLFPVSWSMELTQTYAVILGKKDYQKFMNVVANIDKIGVSYMLNWNYNAYTTDDGQKLGSWIYTGGVLNYAEAGKDQKGNQLYEAVINLQYYYNTTGEGARLGVKPTSTTSEVKTNVFFTKDKDGNYISTGFKSNQ